MKGFYLHTIFEVILILCTSMVFGQRSNGLAVEGKVSVQQGVVEGAIIRMFQDGKRLDNYGIGPDGRYKVELNYNHDYELIFTLQGNFPQKIVVNTDVPRSVLSSDPSFPPFPVDINLFTEIEGIDRSFSENTVLKIFYSQNVDNFISDLYYNDAQIKNLIDQAIAQAQLIGKESDYLSKLTRAEIAELRKEYDKLIEEAENQYSSEQFLDALDGYKAANKIFPAEQYPKDRIAEINDLLGLLMVAGDMEAALAERFTTLIKNADLLFTNKKYFDARNSYNRALSIKPNDAHALARVETINSYLNNQQKEKQYADLVVKGLNAMNEMLFEEALSIFEDALLSKPNDAFALAKIKEINEKLAELAKNLENQKNYEQAIFQAEVNYEKQFYDKALASYENALTFKPGDEKAQNQINEIKALMKKFVNQSLYNDLIKNADKLFKKESWQEALVDYKKALELFPDEEHPNQRVNQINLTLNAQASFAELIAAADKAFNQEKYTEAKSLYQQSLSITPEHKYAQNQIVEIDKRIQLAEIQT